MEITESVPSSRVVVRLDLLKPFASSNTAEYTLVAEGDATTVTWAMYGPSAFVSKVVQVFVTLDKMIGGDFAKGLAAINRSRSERSRHRP